MTKEDRIVSYLNELFPNAYGELKYNKDYELLIAVVLSAQATDKSVNKVTPILFDKYKCLEELAHADLKDVEECIKSIGLYKNKAKNIIAVAKELVEHYDGKVPEDKEALTKLPGVGNKTAGVVRLELFNADEFPVDTHVHRLAIRFGIAKENDDLLTVENKLKKRFPKQIWSKLHHQFVFFGRYFCTAKNPQCENCKISDICKEKH